MKISKNSVLYKLFGYTTTEEMEAQRQKHIEAYERRKKWEKSHQRQLKTERIRNALVRGDEESALQEYLEMEFAG